MRVETQVQGLGTLRVSALFALVYLFLACVHGQYFKPYTAISKKLFAEAAPNIVGHSMAFDSAIVDGADSVFYHFGRLNDTSTFIFPGCSGWGSEYCYRADLPVWSGTLFRTNNIGVYWFRNVLGDSLYFDLAMPNGTSLVFFENEFERFTVKRTGPDTMSVLGLVDSVYTYTIGRTDQNGSPIDSPLDERPILIGKELGLISFFQVDSFPLVQRPLELLGNKGPDVGFHRITSVSLYDYQPGDVVQTRSYSGNTLPNGQPFTYHKRTVLARTETPDSVIYTMTWESFGTTTTDLTFGTYVQRYSKHEVLAELPFDRFDGAHVRLSRSVHPVCGASFWYLFTDEVPGLNQCESFGCWVSADTQGPPHTAYSSLQLGVGRRSYFMEILGSGWGGYYFSIQEILYYKKNGIECGTEVSVTVPEAIQEEAVVFGPNPVDDELIFEATSVIRSIELIDQHGRTVAQLHALRQDLRIDVSQLVPGLYFATIQMENGARSHHRIMVAR